MQSIEIAGDGVAEQIWSRFVARRAVGDSLAALEDAAAALLPLIADTEWSAEGVRALHETIAEFARKCAAAESSLRLRQWELGAAL